MSHTGNDQRIAHWVSEGYSDDEIAMYLDCNIREVKSAVSRLRLRRSAREKSRQAIRDEGFVGIPTIDAKLHDAMSKGDEPTPAEQELLDRDIAAARAALRKRNLDLLRRSNPPRRISACAD